MADELDAEMQRLIHEFLLSQCVDNVADYVKRGRPLSHLDTNSAKQQWADAYRRWLLCPSDPDLLAVHRALEAELALREEPLPMEVVEKESDAWRAVVRKALKAGALPSEPPMDDFMEQLSEFIEARKRPSNRPMCAVTATRSERLGHCAGPSALASRVPLDLAINAKKILTWPSIEIPLLSGRAMNPLRAAGPYQ